MQVPIASCFGSGFFTHVPGGLPQAAKSVLVEMCAIDRLLAEARNRRLTTSQFKILTDARNAAQHRLLSLPDWEHLEHGQRQECLLAVYECCRITAVLYSNAVIFPLPTNTGWHKRLIKSLRRLLETSNMMDWRLNVSALLTWTLFVGGIASYRSPDRYFFENTLRDLMRRERLKWPQVEATLSMFLWSKQACDVGAAVLWDAVSMQVDEVN